MVAASPCWDIEPEDSQRRQVAAPYELMRWDLWDCRAQRDSPPEHKSVVDTGTGTVVNDAQFGRRMALE